MAIIKRKSQDGDEPQPGSSKRARVMLEEGRGTREQLEPSANKSTSRSGKQSGVSLEDAEGSPSGLDQDKSRKRAEEYHSVHGTQSQQHGQLADYDKVPQRKLPEVNAIYRRDIASFLSRAKVEQWRLTSQFSNAVLSEFPSKLPRRRYQRLEIATWNGERTMWNDGYVKSTTPSGFGYGKAIQQISGFRRCCRGLEGSAQVLTGELLFPMKSETDVVILRINTYGSNRQPTLRILNRLTAATAFDFLHFVWHANKECYYKQVDINLGQLASVEEGALNPAVLQRIQRDFALKKPFRFRALYTSSKAINWSAETMEAAQRLVNFKSLGYALCLPSWGEDLPRLLQHLGDRGRFHSKAEVDCYSWNYASNTELIDAIIQHFRDRHEGLASVFRDIHFTIRFGSHQGLITGWPTLCPRTEAVSRSDNSYVFQFQNRITKEGFKLTLRRLKLVQTGWILMKGVSDMRLTID